MADKRAQFTEGAAKKIAETVRAFQRDGPDTGRSRGRGGADTNRAVFVKLTSNASGGGKYNGIILEMATSAISASGNVAASDAGGTNGVTCLICNFGELGASTHDLTNGSSTKVYYPGVITGAMSDGTPAVSINGVDWENCT